MWSEICSVIDLYSDVKVARQLEDIAFATSSKNKHTKDNKYIKKTIKRALRFARKGKYEMPITIPTDGRYHASYIENQLRGEGFKVITKKFIDNISFYGYVDYMFQDFLTWGEE